MRTLRCALLASLLACAATAAAQAPAAPPAGTGIALSPAHMAAALDLARALQLEQYMESYIESMAPPGMRREIIRRVVMQRLDLKAFEAFAARVYGETFSEQELRELTAFYRTEVGRKLQARLPSLQKNVSQAIINSPDMMSNFFVSGCAAGAVSSAAEQARQFQTTVGQPPPSLDDVLRNLGPLLTKAEASCVCMFKVAMGASRNKDASQLFQEPAVKQAIDEAMRSGTCPRPV